MTANQCGLKRPTRFASDFTYNLFLTEKNALFGQVSENLLDDLQSSVGKQARTPVQLKRKMPAIIEGFRLFAHSGTLGSKGAKFQGANTNWDSIAFIQNSAYFNKSLVFDQKVLDHCAFR